MPDYTPKFDKPADVVSICEDMQLFEDRRAQDRALIDCQVNNDLPWTADEVEEYKIEFNINWGEQGRLVDDANRQLNGATIHKDILFTMRNIDGSVEKQDSYTATATKHMNEALTQGYWLKPDDDDEYYQDEFGRRHMFMAKSRNASTILHGVGAQMWTNPSSPSASFIPLENLLIPTDTTLEHENMMWLATNFALTQGELLSMSENDPHWNKSWVRKILTSLQKNKGQYIDQSDPIQQPEKWQEWRKQNGGMFMGSSDAVPKVRLRAFYYRDPATDKWYRKILLRDNIGQLMAKDEFLYDSKDNVFAHRLQNFLYIQYGDVSRVPPLQHNSVRGIGTMTYSPCSAMNRIRCQTAQHVLQNLQTWFRVRDPKDRDRIKAFIMEQYTVMDESLQIVPASERHQIDVRQVEFIQSQMRQLMNEGSSSFVRDVDTGTKKEMTLGEAQIRLQQVNVMVSSMLKFEYAQEPYLFQEYVRRFLNKHSRFPIVKEFQKRCIKDGIPESLMTPKSWRVEIEQVIGDGDQTLAQYKANLLLSQSKEWMDPRAARIAQYKWALVVTGDPATARLLVPEEKDDNTSGAKAAQNLFGTLMTGVSVKVREGIEQTSYVEEMLMMMGEKIMAIQQFDNMGTVQELIGLGKVEADIAAHIQIIERNKEIKDKTKLYQDTLGKLSNELKGFQQRLTEKMEQENAQPDPETLQKIESQKALTQLKLETTAATKDQALEQKAAAFDLKMVQQQQKMIADAVNSKMDREMAAMEAAQEIKIRAMEAAQELRIKEIESRVSIAIKQSEAEAARRAKSAETAADSAKAAAKS